MAKTKTPQALVNPVLTRAEWLRQREAAEKNPGRFHGEIAKSEIHWFLEEKQAWGRFVNGKWQGISALSGERIDLKLPTDFLPWKKSFDQSEAPFYRWFLGGKTNACFNEVDAHVLNGYGDETALIFESEEWIGDGHQGRPARVRRITRAQLFLEVARCALVLKNLGLKKGDRIVLYLPNSPEHVFFIEAAKRLGVIYTCVFGGLSAKTLAERIADTRAKAVVTCDGFYRNGVVVNAKSEFVDVALNEFVTIENALNLASTCLREMHVQHRVEELSEECINRFFANEIAVAVRELSKAVSEWLETREILHTFNQKNAEDTILQKLQNYTGFDVQNVIVVENGIGTKAQKRRERELRYSELLQSVSPFFPSDTLEKNISEVYKFVPPEPVDADFPLFIAYTSGSTGKPKGLVHTHGGYVMGIAHTMRVVFGVEPGIDVIHSIADPGWITGQSYMISAPLVTRVTSVIAEGGPLYPFATRFAELLARNGVTILKAGSTFLRSVSAEASSASELAQFDLRKLKIGSFCAEPVSPSVQKFAMDQLTKRYVNSYWATEHGGIVLTHFFGSAEYPLKPDAHNFALPWIFAEIRVALDAVDSSPSQALRYRLASPGEKGELVITKPYPYLARTIWGDAENLNSPNWKGDWRRFSKTYFERWSSQDPAGKQSGLAYTQGDFACRYEDDSFTLHGRSDEVINTSGHRVGTEEIESAILKDKAVTPRSPVANVIVVGAPHEERGTVPLAFIRLVPGAEFSVRDMARLSKLVSREKGEIAIPAGYIVVKEFPETRSGKYMRRYLKALLNGDELGDTSMLRNPQSIDEISKAIAAWKSSELNSLDSHDTQTSEQIRNASAEERQRLIAAVIQRDIGLQLGFEKGFSLSPTAELMLFGIDSLAAVKLRNRLKISILGEEGPTPPPNLVFAHPTIVALTAYFAQALSSNTSATKAGSENESGFHPDNQLELSEHVTPDRNHRYAWQRPENVFLTGATGYLGSFLLSEIIKQTKATVYCLVRAPSAREGIDRINKTFAANGIDFDVRGRVIAVTGDLSLPAMGLSAKDYAELAERIDTIYHAGALVNHVFPYSALRQANVIGTQDVLRFAVEKRLKIVHNVSSIGVFLSPSHAGQFVGEWTFSNSMEGLIDGYCKSKWTAERLGRIASDRGVPTVTYRPGPVSWHTKTGFFNPTDFVVNLLRICIATGSAPRLEIPFDLAPVDYVTEAIVRLSLNAENVARTFHLTNPKTVRLPETIEMLNALGLSIRLVPLTTWLEELDRTELRDDRFAVSCRNYYIDAEGKAIGQLGEDPLPVFDVQNTLRGLHGSNIRCVEINSEYLSKLVKKLGYSTGEKHASGRRKTA